jgi:hypothetical protein
MDSVRTQLACNSLRLNNLRIIQLCTRLKPYSNSESDATPGAAELVNAGVESRCGAVV